MSGRPWLHPVEMVLLFAALFFTLPYIPSHEMDSLPLLPAGGIAVGLFAASRFIRWGRLWFIALIEVVGFAAFVWASNAAANVIYHTSG